MKKTLSLTCILIFALLVAACSPAPAAEEEPMPAAEAPMPIACDNSYEGKSLTIYQQAGLTGPQATLMGTGFISGLQDALDQINADGGVCGVTLVLRVEDTQYVLEQEVQIYEQFRAETPKPLLITTSNSAATIALKDRVVEDEIVNLATGVNTQALYDPPNGYTVGMVPIYSDQFAGFMQFVHDNWADIKPEGAGDEITVGVIGWANAFGAGAIFRSITEAGLRQDLDKVYGYFPRLSEFRRRTSGYLSGGEQQMVAIGRALMAKPKLMLLDEPSLGLAPLLVQSIFKVIRRINVESGVSMLLVEQNANVALRSAAHAYVIETGRIVLDGPAEQLAQNADIKEFYLGLTQVGERNSYRDVKHYKRRKR